MKHRWKMYGDEIDAFATQTGDFHNGPFCIRCKEGFCEHCTPEIYEEECPGDKYQQMGQLSLFGEDVA